MRSVDKIRLPILILLAIPAWCAADVLVTSDGRTLEGLLIRQDERSVVFEVHRAGMTTRVEFRPQEVERIEKKPLAATSGSQQTTGGTPSASSSGGAQTLAEPVAPPIVAYDKPTYYLIPMRGTVGATMTAAVLEKCLADAARRKPTVVILEMDSPGGIIQEVPKLADVIEKYKKQLRIVVLVRQAVSAAAITALASEEIYIRRTAIFGAATAYKLNAVSGMPENIEEKMDSIWRATARSCAEVGNHSTLLAEGMIDNRIQLYARERNGKIEISTAGGEFDRLIKQRGKLLTLTAREAVDCSLARGLADDVEELGQVLGKGGWVECKGIATAVVEHWEKQVAQARKEFDGNFTRCAEAMKLAAVNDPASFNDYRVFARTQEFTPESARNWELRSARCIAALSTAERELGMAEKLAERFPQVLPDSRQIEQARQNIRTLREHISARAQRR